MNEKNSAQECEAIHALMDLYHQEKLSEEETYRINVHLLFCPDCVYLNLAG